MRVQRPIWSSGASPPNQLWVADITYLQTLAGFLFLAVVMDVYSRRIVGWAIANQTLLRLAKLAIAELPQRGVYKGVASLGGFDRKLNDLGAR